MAELKGIEYLRKKLKNRSQRVITRYKQYDMKYVDLDAGITIPPQIKQQYRSVLGWCSKAVDAMADRLIFREFSNDEFEINDIFNVNNPDILFDSAILSALISSCCFIYIAQIEGDLPRLEVIDGGNATGVIDATTGLLTEGYAVLERDDRGNAKLEAYFIPGKTIYYLNGQIVDEFNNKSNLVTLVPIIHRPDAKRPFGRSRISRAAMYFQRYAKRTLERSDITAEFYSFPQKYILGLDPKAEMADKWKATISSLLQYTKDDDGDRPTVGQFQVASMSPFTEQLRTAAAGFAGETGLTLDDLGFISDNPSSAEAIKASHENLRAMARKAQRCFGSGLLNVGYISTCLRDNYLYSRHQFFKTTPKWYPVFEPDASTLSLIGDGVIKLNQAIPGYLDEENLIDQIGF